VASKDNTTIEGIDSNLSSDVRLIGFYIDQKPSPSFDGGSRRGLRICDHRRHGVRASRHGVQK
jgi:hypothetical protein